MHGAKYQLVCLWNHSSRLFCYLVRGRTLALLSSHLGSSHLGSSTPLPYLLTSHLVSFHLVLPRHVSSLTFPCFTACTPSFSICLLLPPLLWPWLLSSLASSLTLPCIYQVSWICMFFYLLSHFVQSSDWSPGPAGDEVILILSGILPKLVVFSTRTVATERGDIRTYWPPSALEPKDRTTQHQPKGAASAETLWMYTYC